MIHVLSVNQPQIIHQALQVLFEEIVPSAIATATVTEQQDGIGLWIVLAAIVIPPVPDRITGERPRIMARSNLDVPFVARQVIQAMGNGDTRR